MNYILRHALWSVIYANQAVELKSTWKSIILEWVKKWLEGALQGG